MKIKKKKLKKKKLLKLPVRDWKITSEYDSVGIVATGKKHESGYMIMAIVGFSGLKPIEIAGYCDDISWIVHQIENKYEFRNDMLYPSGIIHFWSRKYQFKVSDALSSMDIQLINKERKS